MYDDVVKRRPKHCYDDECCIAPGELDDEETSSVPSSPKTPNGNANGSVRKKSKVTSVVTKHDEQVVKPKSKARSSSTVR